MKCRKSQKAQPHLQLYRNSLSLESTRVGDVSNHDMELSRSTNVIVAAGAKSRQKCERHSGLKKLDNLFHCLTIVQDFCSHLSA